MQRLNQIYHNKQKKITKEKEPPQDVNKETKLSNAQKKEVKPDYTSKKTFLQSQDKTTEATLDFYEYIFETRIKEGIRDENIKQKKREKNPLPNPILTPRQRKKMTVFESRDPNPSTDPVNQMERWLKLFTDRMESGDS